MFGINKNTRHFIEHEDLFTHLSKVNNYSTNSYFIAADLHKTTQLHVADAECIAVTQGDIFGWQVMYVSLSFTDS